MLKNKILGKISIILKKWKTLLETKLNILGEKNK